MEEKAFRNIKNHQNGTDRVENTSNVQSNEKLAKNLSCTGSDATINNFFFCADEMNDKNKSEQKYRDKKSESNFHNERRRTIPQNACAC